ncbi:DUF732 domain-containing protein [Mycobacterium ostraviense]|uniref:DUF732 domain-containing protein n=1 Tax=Mycobacterium ostraviense TaxID=2738409 RepID=UPI001E2F9E19|nr:DUF732 domain-containing protein [Mycobacterium ostraviense]UGT94319.1 DUF732 domain-containing protein [Mycobacterium ostraviense]
MDPISIRRPVTEWNPAVSTTGTLVSASAVVIAAIVCGGVAGADPNQDQQFLALLAELEIPAVDNVPVLIARAHQICKELDHGTSFQRTVNENTDMIYADDPSLQRVSDRVNRTAVRFSTASVVVYCPSHRGELP